MSAIQLNFTIRTSSKCKTVHLVGSWDNYKSTLPLNKDSTKSGGWKATFRFSQPALMPGGRYWYYYIIDGFQVSHDPARDHTVESTTGRKLNILDIPVGKRHSSHSHGYEDFVPDGYTSRPTISGRSLSPSQIQHPLPSRPYETRHFRGDSHTAKDMEALARQYTSQRLQTPGSSSDSDLSSRGSSRRSRPSNYRRGSGSSSPSSVSSVNSPITPASFSGSPDLPGTATFELDGKTTLGFGSLGDGVGCVCNRWALMSTGEKVRLNCGGAVCGSSSSEQGCDSSSEDGHKSRKKHGGGGGGASGSSSKHRRRRSSRRRKSSSSSGSKKSSKSSRR